MESGELRKSTLALLKEGGSFPQFLLDHWQKTEQFDPNVVVTTRQIANEADKSTYAQSRSWRNIGILIGAGLGLLLMLWLARTDQDTSTMLRETPRAFWIFTALFMLIFGCLVAMIGSLIGSKLGGRKFEQDHKWGVYWEASETLDELLTPVIQFLTSWSRLDGQQTAKGLVELQKLSLQEAKQLAEDILVDGAYRVLWLEVDNIDVPQVHWLGNKNALAQRFEADFGTMKDLGLIEASKTYKPYYDMARERLEKEVYKA